MSHTFTIFAAAASSGRRQEASPPRSGSDAPAGILDPAEIDQRARRREPLYRLTGDGLRGEVSR
jgi:hypothetical protein